MAISNNAIFTQTPIIALGQATTANTNRDGTGTLATIVTGSTNGTRIDRITIEAIGTTAAGVIRLFIFDGVSTTRLWREILTSAVTPSATVTVDSHILSGVGLILPTGYILKASTHNSETWNIIVEGGNF